MLDNTSYMFLTHDYFDKPTVQFLRKKPHKAVIFDLDEDKAARSEDGSKIYWQPPGGKKIGVLFAGVHPNAPGKVMVGFSLLHKNDKFDHVYLGNKRPEHVPNFGKQVAAKRAYKWHAYKKVIDGHMNGVDSKKHKIVPIPYSMKKELVKFLTRCKRYYKDKQLPEWSNYLLRSSVANVTTYKPDKPELLSRLGIEVTK